MRGQSVAVALLASLPSALVFAACSDDGDRPGNNGPTAGSGPSQGGAAGGAGLSGAYAIDLAAIVKTVNWTNSAYADPQAGFLAPFLGGQPDQAGRPVAGTFSMPGTDPQGEQQYSSAWTTYYAASPASASGVATRVDARTLA